MEWKVHGSKSIYQSDWVSLQLVEVGLPDGSNLAHHVIRASNAAACVLDVNGSILMIWRHRFITDTWGWEIPAGRVDPGEAPEDGARRECVEETGYLPGALSPVTRYFPSNGLSDQTFSVYSSHEIRSHSQPVDINEAEAIAWVPHETVIERILGGHITDGLTLTGLSSYLLRLHATD